MVTRQITVLGTGDMGGAITTALAQRTNHSVAVRGSRPDSDSAKALVATLGVRRATGSDIAHSDVVFVVVPARAIPELASVLHDYEGVVVSVSVSSDVARDGERTTAETLATLLPRARVVNAFSSVWSTVVRDPGSVGKTSIFVCADNDGAKTLVSALAAELGFEPIDAGKLSNALYAEALGAFAVVLALEAGYGQTITFRTFRATNSGQRLL